MRQDISFRFHRDGRVSVAKDKAGQMLWEVTLEAEEWSVIGEAWKRTEEARNLPQIGMTTLREQKP